MASGIWVFTDPRFDDMKITCAGSCTFNVWCKMNYSKERYYEDGWANTDCFTVYQNKDTYAVDYDFALAQASEHFDEMAAELEEDDA